MADDMLTPMTAEQLFALPDDGQRHELIAGELTMMSPAGIAHGIVVGNLTVLLGSHVLQQKLGRVTGAETGFLIQRDPDTVRAPDLAFISTAGLSATDDAKSYGNAAPELAVEVISPSDRSGNIEEKVQVWLEAGCREVWVVSPILRTVTLYHSLTEVEAFAGSQIIESSRVLPGMSCPLTDVFAGLKPEQK